MAVGSLGCFDREDLFGSLEVHAFDRKGRDQDEYGRGGREAQPAAGAQASIAEFGFRAELRQRTEHIGRRGVTPFPFAFPLVHPRGIFRGCGDESEKFTFLFWSDPAFEITNGEFFEAFVHGTVVVWVHSYNN